MNETQKAVPTPGIPTWLIWRCWGPSLAAEEILGELEVEFRRRRLHSRFGAWRWYWREALSICCHAFRSRHPSPNATQLQLSIGRTLKMSFSGFFGHDFRLAIRSLSRSPGFTLIALASLILGIGASTLIFSFVNALFLRPPFGVAAPEQLVAIYTSGHRGNPYSVSSYPDFRDIRGQVDALSDATAYVLAETMRVSDQQGTRERMGVRVAGNYFQLLGAQPVIGRAFQDHEAGSPLAVLGHGAWLGSFAGDPGILSRTVRLNGRVYAIVGVAPRDLTAISLPVEPFAYVPLEREWLAERGTRGLNLLGRLRKDATLEGARQQLEVLGRRLAESYPETWRDSQGEPRSFQILTERETRVPPNDRAQIGILMGVLMVVALLVLAIACFNLASLVMARNTRRTRELAIRQALGSGLLRMMGLLLWESALLAGAGALGGILAAHWIVRAVAGGWLLPDLPATLLIGIDSQVLAFALLIALLTTTVIGWLPAWRSARIDLVSSIKGNPSDSRLGRAGLRRALVTAQVAASVVLVVATALFIRSIQSAAQVDLGFDPDGVVVASLDLSAAQSSPEAGLRFQRDLLERLSGLPGVSRAALSNMLPLSGQFGVTSLSIEGHESPQGEEVEASENSAFPGYFEALRMPIVAGRAFREEDGAGSPAVVLVNQAFARRYWPGGQALGKRLRVRGRDAEVIGVVRDAMYRNIGEEPIPRLWTCGLQFYSPRFFASIRGDGETRSLISSMADALQEAAPELPMLTPMAMRQMTYTTLLPQRMASRLLTFASGFALALALVGIYGLMSYAVNQRFREMGIRMAIGAARRDLIRLVLREGLALSILGLALGLVAALGLSGLISSLLIGIHPLDPLSFATGALLLIASAGVASLVPAVRASRFDPMRALRQE